MSGQDDDDGLICETTDEIGGSGTAGIGCPCAVVVAVVISIGAGPGATVGTTAPG